MLSKNLSGFQCFVTCSSFSLFTSRFSYLTYAILYSILVYFPYSISNYTSRRYHLFKLSIYIAIYSSVMALLYYYYSIILYSIYSDSSNTMDFIIMIPYLILLMNDFSVSYVYIYI